MHGKARHALLTAGMTLTFSLAAGLAIGAPSAWADPAADTTPPSTPTNLHQVDAGAAPSVSTIAWNAATDDSGTIRHYWVNNLDQGTRSKPSKPTMLVAGLLSPYCDVPHDKTIYVTVQAVDAAGNVSAPSAPVPVKIN
jgi:hypothetical protein